MPARACPHCGVETPQGRVAFWRHVRACDKNPDPTCPKCGMHFVPDKLADHVERCGSHKQLRAAADASATAAPPAPTSDPAPTESPNAQFLQDVPPERLTPTDELVLPLLAPPSEKPTPPPSAPQKAKRAPRARKAVTAAEDAAPETAPPAAAAPTDEGLAAKFEQGRPAPRLAAWGGFADSIKRNWVLLLVIAVLVAAVLVWRRMAGDDAGAPVQPAATTPPPTTSRPPYNPELHGSLEHYRAAYGHLPTINGGA